MLLILAGVSLSAVFSQEGIFTRTEEAGEKYREAKARETLELALSDAQYEKYTNPEYNNNTFLDKLIEKEVPGSEVEDDTIILDGYIFELDRDVPKLGANKGRAKGVSITAIVNGNNSWVKVGDSVNVTGTIKTYNRGATIQTVSATKDEEPIVGFKIDEKGKYTINEITEDTTIIVTATDSKGDSSSKEIEVNIIRDIIEPTITSVNAKAERMTITISAEGNDKNLDGQEESGLKEFSYEIKSTQDSSLKGIPTEQKNGTFNQGETVTIQALSVATEETTYTIIIKAEDNAGNITGTDKIKTVEVTTIDGITLEEAKNEVNDNTLPDYLGKRIIDYNPEAKGTWRVFYYDGANYFGDGQGTLYLKRDYDEKLQIKLSDYNSYNTTDNAQIMKQMNPLWNKYNSCKINQVNSHSVAWLCDPNRWTEYKTSQVKYAIGSPSVEMYMKAYDAYGASKTKFKCEIKDEWGYVVGPTSSGTTGNRTDGITLQNGPHNMFMTNGVYWWLSSPAYTRSDSCYEIRGDSSKYIGADSNTATNGICPIVAVTK